MNVPKLRFKEFDGEWEEKKLKNLILTVEAGVSVNSENEPVNDNISKGVLKTSAISKGIFNYRENKKVIEADLERVKKPLKKDTILVSRMNTPLLVGEIGYVDKDYPNIYLPDRLWELEVDKNITSAKWIVSALVTDINEYKIKSLGTGTSGSMKNIAKSDFLNIDINVPTLEEQLKIQLFMGLLNKKIKLQQQKIDLLQEQKKGLLQKMFPKSGEKKPQVRFAGFTDDWEQRKLGELVNITTGKLDANAMIEEGKYDFYTSGIKKYRIDIPAFEGPAITIAGNGATVGYMHLADGKFNAYQRTYVLTKFDIDRQFLFSEIGNCLPRKITQEARAGNIPYIVMDMLTDLKILVPEEKEEQEKIGAFFKQLDDTIALHQRKLDLYKEQKKSLMQQMFI